MPRQPASGRCSGVSCATSAGDEACSGNLQQPCCSSLHPQPAPATCLPKGCGVDGKRLEHEAAGQGRAGTGRFEPAGSASRRQQRVGVQPQGRSSRLPACLCHPHGPLPCWCTTRQHPGRLLSWPGRGGPSSSPVERPVRPNRLQELHPVRWVFQRRQIDKSDVAQVLLGGRQGSGREGAWPRGEAPAQQAG